MVRLFFLLMMPVVTFASLIVITKGAKAIHPKRQAILKPCGLPGMGSGKRHTTISTKASSEITRRSLSISLAFMLEILTTAAGVVKHYNTCLCKRMATASGLEKTGNHSTTVPVRNWRV